MSLLDDDKRAKLRSETFGFVFQQYNLIPWLTAYENTALPFIFSGKRKNNERLYKLFQEMGLEKRLHHRPTELSGGEQQRVAILRALANNPDIILADEPTGNLDLKTGEKILDILINLNKVHKKTLVIITHDLSIAQRVDQILTIKDGRLVRNTSIYKN